MFALFISLALLGLSAIDPIGIAIMPVLLLRKKPFMHSFVFLAGSFASLMVIGLLFSQLIQTIFTDLESNHSWLIPTLETIAGIVLLIIGFVLFWRLKKGKLSVKPTGFIVKELKHGGFQIFLVGFALVAIQSIFDVVFLVAMARVGQMNLSNIVHVTAIAVYSLAAILIQAAVVLAYKISPPRQRIRTLGNIENLLNKYAYKLLILVSLLLGCLLLAVAA
jgi:hypothetical protein